MKLRNLAVVFCAASALLAACSDDDAIMNGGSGAGGKSTAGAAGKNGGGASGKGGDTSTAGDAGKGGSAGVESAGAAGEAGNAGNAGTAGEGGEGGEGGAAPISETFTVTLENVAPSRPFTSSGVFNKPDMALVPGPAAPGQSYKFTVDAGRKQKLFFATMLAGTNDVFFAPDGAGIPLYLEDGSAITGDVTNKVYLWDAGTEVNQEPFIGADTGSNQTSANMGAVDTNNKVRKVTLLNSGFPFAYPAVDSLIKVTVTHVSGTTFTITIANLPGAALDTGLPPAGVSHPTPLANGVWAVSSNANALFTDQLPAPAQGLEALAEDGDPTTLGTYLMANSGITYPASPGVWLLHKAGTKSLFTAGAPDLGKGLEAIAEDGDPTILGANLPSLSGYVKGAVFSTPVGTVIPSAILPGKKYQFTFNGSPGDSLSFATMLAATNDVFLGTTDIGIPLFNAGGVALSGDISSQVFLWDAGTEGNEKPAIGPNTVTNQLNVNTGTPGEGKVQLLSGVLTDTYAYPSAAAVLKVTVTQ